MPKPKPSDISVKPSKYWVDRATEQELKAAKVGVKTSKEVQAAFKKTFADINAEISRFYETNGSIELSPTFKTLADGTKVISGYSNKNVVPSRVAFKKVGKVTRLTQLQLKLHEILKTLARDYDKQIAMNLSSLIETTYAESLFTVYNGIGIGRQFNMLTDSTVRTLLYNEVNGKNYSERIWTNTEKLADTLDQTLKTGIIQGLSNTEMSKRVASNMATGFNVANTLIRTEVTNVLNQATLESYKDSGVVEQYEYLATLDSKTSTICEELDGDLFNVEDAVTGLNFPPMHTRCRSTTIPHFDDSQQLYTRIARDDFGDSFVIPAGTTFEQYKQMK